MATPPVFTSGSVLLASEMNKIGLWLITTQTVGSGVGSVTVSNAFSSDFNAYRVTLSGGTSSNASTSLNLTLGATATGYYYAYSGWSYPSAGTSAGLQNQTSFAGAGLGGSLINTMQIDIFEPYNANYTWVVGKVNLVATTGFWRDYGGYLANTTSYTDFTITAAGQTMTGGEISVYGYRR